MKSILYEVKMSPARLEKMSATANATVGFEIELAVPSSSTQLPRKNFKTREQLMLFTQKYLPNLVTKLQTEIDQYTSTIKTKNPSVIRRAEDQFVSANYPDSSKLEAQNNTFSQVGDSIATVLNKPTKSSDKQHSVPRDSTHYIIETDSSIRPPAGYEGIEIVSPPMPLTEALNDLEKLHKWAANTGAITNQSTGLHIGVSVPNMRSVDFLKLAVFVGDEYVLGQFSRSTNIYSPSTLKEIKRRVEEFHADPAKFNQLQKLFAVLKQDLATNAEDLLQMFPIGIKNMSLHFKESYVEFRSPGGNWLVDQEFSSIVSTVHRFVVALSIAANPNQYRREYAIKLFKMLNLSQATGIDLFAKWAAGSVTLDTIKQHQSSVPVVIISQTSKPVRVLKNNQPVAIVFGTSNSEIKQGLHAAGIDFESEKANGAKFSIVSLTGSEAAEINLKSAIRG